MTHITKCREIPNDLNFRAFKFSARSFHELYSVSLKSPNCQVAQKGQK